MMNASILALELMITPVSQELIKFFSMAMEKGEVVIDSEHDLKICFDKDSGMYFVHFKGECVSFSHGLYESICECLFRYRQLESSEK